MNILKGVRRLSEVLLLLSFISFTASPITSLLGIQQPPVDNTIELLRFAIISGFVIILIAVLAVFGFGYIILTGWRQHRRIPKAIRLLLAFTLGALAFSLSGPISLILPIPFLPTVLTTILLWAALRAVSNLFPNLEPEPVKVDEAIASARYLVKQVDPTATNVDVLESKTNGKHWRVTMLSNPSARKYEIEVDMEKGGITGWKSA
jgi:hypothetical protein